MYYHASNVKGIEIIEPRVSNHGIPLIYFSKKRENVLVYLSNAVEKYCKETNYNYNGIWKKWASYGFDKSGKQYIEEYYPNALKKTYKGVSGYIYITESISESDFETNIPNTAVSNMPVKVSDVEFVPDALDAILEAEKKGLLKIVRYEEMTENMIEMNNKMIIKEYEKSFDHPDYRHFLIGNFPELLHSI